MMQSRFLENSAVRPIICVCIPTYERVDALRTCVLSLVAGLSGADIRRLRIIVSDNNPASNLSDRFQEMSLPQELDFQYFRNPVNLGMSGNFLRCAELAADAEYFWMLGDDDFLLPGVVSKLVELLCTEAPDCVFLECRGRLWTTFAPKDYLILNAPGKFLAYANYYTTFMSSFVVRLRGVKSSIMDANRPKETFLDQLGWLFPAIRDGKRFLILPHQCFTFGSEVTGGYEFDTVFVKSFWTIWRNYFNSRRFVGAKAITRVLQLTCWYPVMILNYRIKPKNIRYKARNMYKSFILEFYCNALFWLFTAPSFFMPLAVTNIWLKLLKPIRVIAVVVSILFVHSHKPLKKHK
jgi:glycosyltransferase involved in cell wall biosynthesis